ncbi:hypothetical protein WJX81_007817 [Elliptochloris bilobata]|uniref:Fungal lipase-type domain-containing protein n=1 Tax=Elliptochloris bilobata TaxID=381761 RepID=A0AAW1S6G4_9CHLO
MPGHGEDAACHSHIAITETHATPLAAYTEDSVVGQLCQQKEAAAAPLLPYAQVQRMELSYQCGDVTAAALLGDTITRTLTELGYAIVSPLMAALGSQLPSTAAGTSAVVLSALRDAYPAEVMNLASNLDMNTFMDITRGLRWPGGPTGGALRSARHMRVLTKPTLGEYTTMVVLDHAPLPSLPGPITSDTQVVVAAFQAPAPPTQVAFFFHSTETLNPCMWATDFDLTQTAYPAPNCNGCMVHRGFLRAFQSVVANKLPGYTLDAVAANLTGVRPADMTLVLCSGHSLGAALATLCGAWAKAIYPNAVVKVITSGSPRLFNSAAAAWYDRYMGAGNYIRLVNNRDVVPSMPFQHTPVGQFQHVGAPIWMMRSAKELPGNYTAFAAERPEWYTGSVADHNLGYVLAMRQILNCRPSVSMPGAI